jgi:hypothetical protein
MDIEENHSPEQKKVDMSRNYFKSYRRAILPCNTQLLKFFQTPLSEDTSNWIKALVSNEIAKRLKLCINVWRYFGEYIRNNGS